MDRRSFFSFLPMVPVVVGAAIVSESSKGDTPEDNYNTLTLRAMKRNKINPMDTPIRFLNQWEQDESRSVTFGVGRDGNLWIKILRGAAERGATCRI